MKRDEDDVLRSVYGHEDTIKGYHSRQPKAGVQEDGSYVTKDGRVYDPETKKLRKPKEPVPKFTVPPKTHKA